jgi:tRNA threonylcarbamoyladenosine biosynthesis protein TsaB
MSGVESARAWSASRTYLALDTSTPRGSVCVGVGSRVVAQRVIEGQGSHSSDLIPAIGGVLLEARADLSEIAGIVVGAGPGSFTGVRVAAATAKGLAHALDIPLWAVSSLEAAAAAMDVDHSEPLSDEERACPRYVLFDARSDRVYGACYLPTGSGFEVLIPPHSTTIGAVLSEGVPFPDGVPCPDGVPVSVFVGDGAQRHADEIRGAGFTLLPAPFGVPDAAGLLKVVADSPACGPVEEVARWQPDYLRSSSAQRSARPGASAAGP